jgi:acetyltransferase-like isoleucine patch superfamily enzyme
MSIAVKIRRGQGPFWGTLKKIARGVLHFNIPVAGPTRLLFRLLYLVHVSVREWWAWALRFFWYEPLFRSQCTAVGAGFRLERLPYILGKGRIVLGRNVCLDGKIDIGFSNRLHDLPELVIGDDTFIGHSCGLVVGDSVRIGNHVLIAGGVRIADFDGHPVDAERRRAKEPTPPEGIRPIVICDDVWIGTGAMIMKGVTIGARSIVGAGAVVTKDVPPDVVVAGNPARVVKHLKAAEPVEEPATDTPLPATTSESAA